MKINDKKQRLTDEDPNDLIVRSLNKSKRKAIVTNAIATSAFILMILPICAIFTFIYYGYGISESRGNHFLKVIEHTIAITEPNLLVDTENISHEIDLFSMTGVVDLYKQVGSKSKLMNTTSYKLWLNQIDWPNKKVKHSNDFIHPSEERSLNKYIVNERLNNLPEGTVTEMFVSFDSFYNRQEIEKMFSDFDLELVWFAVNNGVNHEEGTLLGFPASTNGINSSFNHQSNSEQFIDVLKFLSEYEEWVKHISRRNISSLDISETLDYIEQNGVEIYGVVVTGPTKEFLKIDRLTEVRDYDIGAVELWDWK